MSQDLGSEQLEVVLVESQSDIISEIHSLLSEIKECHLRVQSSNHGLTSQVEANHPDLVLLSHQANVPALVTEIREKFPDTYAIVLLPSFDEDLVNQYISCGAKGIVFKNENFEKDFVTTMKRVLIRIVERKAFLLESLSRSNFFAANRDLEMLLLRSKSLQPGQTVLHYKIVEALGEGGMGEVYRAEDQRLRRQVAIKVLSPKVMRDTIARKRLMREAVSASALNHPNIITIYAIEETQDLSFIAMEFVEGESLYRILKRGPMPFSQLLEVGSQIADALSVAHAAGLIHRDIKPGNIMLSTRGQVKLLDFGLAKWVTDVQGEISSDSVFSGALTNMGVPIGTINYMSPEQARGETLDTRTDIFSLGSSLYEAATGKVPFRGASILDVLHDIAKAQLELPSKVKSSLPAGFDSVIEKAMAKHPDDRYQSASEFSEALKKLKRTGGEVRMTTSDRPVRAAIDPAQKSDAPGKTIFLVEDNEDNRDMLTRRLHRKGFHVRIATNGRDALDHIPAERPDLILMDISLPLVDGIEVSRQLKSSEETKHIPIIALTAHAMAGDREKAMAAGCDDYDTKPVDFQRLLDKILQWLDKK